MEKSGQLGLVDSFLFVAEELMDFKFLLFYYCLGGPR
jgi:hypothetical protein